MTATVEETIEHLDFDYEIECESTRDCGNRADGYVLHLCCKGKKFFCLSCWELARDALMFFDALGQNLVCASCGHQGNMYREVEWVPLR